MKCTCSRKDLKEALQAVSKALPEKPQTPILGGIYMRAENSALEIQATDFSMSVIAKIPANIEADGAIVVLGKYLPDIVSKLSGEIVIISSEEATANFTSEAASYNLLTMNPEDFQLVEPQNDFIHSFKVKVSVLKNLIRRSSFACAKDSSRPVFTGCCVEVTGSEIKFIATNTHRIAVVQDDILDNESDFEFIVPAEYLRELLSMLEAQDKDELVTVKVSDNSVAFSFEDIFMETRLIDGQFPSSDKMLDVVDNFSAEVKTADMRAAMGRVEVVTSKTEYNTITFSFSQEGLKLTATALSMGNFEEHVDAKVEGDDLEISFDARYIIDLLRVATEDTLKFVIKDVISPIKIKEVGNDNFSYVMTPVRTRN